MIYNVADLFPAKLLKEGISVQHFEGVARDNEVTLKLRETRHFEPEYLIRSLVTLLNMVKRLELLDQQKLLRLSLEAMEGRECHLLDLNGATMVRFPDRHGDPKGDEYLQFIISEKPQKTPRKKRSKTRKASR
jgi:hypothetical protein